MTTEEKAKAYDEAIERAKSKLHYPDKPCFVDVTEIFPELAEREDERIRKAIKLMYSFLPNKPKYIGDVSVEDMFAWLEKQGEHANFRNKIQIGDKVTRNEDGVLVNLSQLNRVAKKDENQEYQKPAWTIQDAKDGDVLCDYCEEFDNPLIFILKKFERVDFGLVKPSDYSSYCFLTAGDRQVFKEGKYHHKYNIKPSTKEQRDLLFKKMHEAGYEWDAEKKELKKIEQKPAEVRTTGYWNVQDIEQKPTEWSGEDEQYLEDTLNLLEGHRSKNTYGDVVEWLKELKDRIIPQPKQEWSEEEIENCAREAEDNNCIILAKHIRQLKSLRPQSTWKPSEEQMRVLDLAIKCGINRGTTEETTLISLFNNLKKLKK